MREFLGVGFADLVQHELVEGLSVPSEGVARASVGLDSELDAGDEERARKMDIEKQEEKPNNVSKT